MENEGKRGMTASRTLHICTPPFSKQGGKFFVEHSILGFKEHILQHEGYPSSVSSHATASQSPLTGDEGDLREASDGQRVQTSDGAVTEAKKLTRE